MRANYVDRLLAEADGALATIWITLLVTSPEAPSVEALRRAAGELVRETPRLRARWRSPERAWVGAALGGDEASVRELGEGTLAGLTAAIVAAPIDLATEPPLRVSTGRLLPERAGEASRHLIALQLHHALGDARSLMFVTRRFFALYAGRAAPGDAIGEPRMTDAAALREALRHPLGVLSLARAKHRLLAPRGRALARSGDRVGAPMLASLRVRLPPEASPGERSRLFFAAVLAGVASCLSEASPASPVRLRVPVDLRRSLGIGATLENACSALAVEISARELRAAVPDRERLASLVPRAIARRLRAGVHWGTLLECMLVSRVATRSMLRDHLRPDVLAPRRANTMVVTYVGRIDRYLETAPFPIATLQTQTPTWGANGFSFGDALVINATCFEGVWTAGELRAFLGAARAWLARHAGASSELIA